MYRLVPELIVSVLSTAALSHGACPLYCPDYYWRDYTGSIPYDAFVGGVNTNDTLYVGQVFFREWNLLPATIHGRTGLAHSNAFGHLLITTDYVKILASPDNSIFEWIPIESKDLHLYLNRAIPGGSELGQPLYIGRVRYEQDIFFGKVFKDDQNLKGLWIRKVNQEPKNFLSYELLTYRCNRIIWNKAQDELTALEPTKPEKN